MIDFSRFKTTFSWVAIAHVILLLIVTFITLQKPNKPPLIILELLPQGALVRGDGGVPPPSKKIEPPPLESQPLPPPSIPKTAPPPTDTIIPKNEPSPTAIEPPSDFAIQSKKKKAEEKKSVPSQKSEIKTPKPPIKINLKEITRTSSNASATQKEDSKKTSSADNTADADTSSGISASAVKGRLSGRMGKAGVSSALIDGISGSPTGTATSSETTEYYTLIRDVYYDVWKQPMSLSGKKLSAILKIRIAKNGKILQTSLEKSSNNSIMDQTVQVAATAVKSIGSPLPDALGTQFADITITFEF